MILNIFNSKLTFFFLPVVIFLIILALSKTTIITSKFVLFDKLNNKNELQQSEMSNLIFSARPEFFVYLNAIKDKPFLGHGSYPNG
jgi:O-antigen ligase